MLHINQNSTCLARINNFAQNYSCGIYFFAKKSCWMSQSSLIRKWENLCIWITLAKQHSGRLALIFWSLLPNWWIWQCSLNNTYCGFNCDWNFLFCCSRKLWLLQAFFYNLGYCNQQHIKAINKIKKSPFHCHFSEIVTVVAIKSEVTLDVMNHCPFTMDCCYNA